MDEIYRKTFINCRVYLVENIHYENLIDLILQHEVLPKATIEDINSLSNRRQKVRKLLDVLPRRSNETFETFLRCLEITDQKHIAKTLKDKLDEIRSQNSTNLREHGFLPPLKVHSSSGYELLPKQLPEFKSLPEHDIESNNTEVHAAVACSEPSDPHFWLPESQQNRESQRDCYEMSSSPRGYILIINNEKFTVPYPLDDRSGSSKDANDLRELFWRLGFFCDIKHNLKVEEMKQILSGFSKMDEHKNLSCCAVVLMSHGDEDHIYGTMGKKVSVNELIMYFNDQNCPNLKDKPKLFIIQTCRNNNNSTTKTGDQNDVSQKPQPMMMRLMSLDLSSSDAEKRSVNLLNVGSRADMLIAYSTAHGNRSFRHKMTGSIFIQNIIEVFNKKADTTSVTDMLIEVNRKLREQYPRQGQIGVPEVALTKKWYLKPIIQ